MPIMTNNLLRLAGLGLLASIPLFASRCAAASVSSPAYRATPGKADARVAVQTAPGQAVFSVHSPSGIGSAEVEQVSGPTPTRLLLRFYLRGLEELRFTYPTAEVRVSVSSSSPYQVTESVTVDGDAQPITPASPYWMDVHLVAADGSQGTIPLKAGGYVEVVTPPHFLDSAPRHFSMAWIDFFR